MTAKFKAFKAALEVLCIEHGVRLGAVGYDDCDLAVYDADSPVYGDPQELSDYTRGTPEEQAIRAALIAEEEARREAEHQRRHEEAIQKCAANDAALRERMMQVGWYQAAMERAEAEAQEQRNKEMRVSTNPNDPAYIDDRPRRAWCNDIEIHGWTVADEFRRVVITPEKVHNGAVRIERLGPGEGTDPRVAAPATVPIDAGFAGVMVHTPDPQPAAAPAEAAPPAAPATEPDPTPAPARAPVADFRPGRRR